MNEFHLCGLPKDVHILALPGMNILVQEFEQLRHTILTLGPR